MLCQIPAVIAGTRWATRTATPSNVRPPSPALPHAWTVMAGDQRNQKSFGTMVFGVLRFGRVWSRGGPGYRDRRFGGRRSIQSVADVLLLAVDSWGGVASMIALAGGLRDLGVSTRIAAYSDFGDKVRAAGCDFVDLEVSLADWW